MQIDWQKGLIPVVTQDENGEVLMLAYMNEEAFKLSCESGYAHYFSRSKNRIWKKGESSGNTQKIKQIKLDCDNDAILLKVEQIGAACHTGYHSCFFKELDILENSRIPSEKKSRIPSEENSRIPNANTPSYGILDGLYHICLERKLSGDESTSYTAKLYKKAPNS
ncbi:MAG: phosphoribosyl-AMP cyclohydrolase, partial [Campylobacter sp.]|nr:phosphoribosyl-AMP cyclohydrolase [Campylobacter sp.]